MSEITNISWCDSTFNPWIGCTKVSPGCAHCYAERDFDLRKHVAKWGVGQPRHLTSAAYWKQPRKWDREAEIHERICEANRQSEPSRPRVFCASLADWLDDEVPVEWLGFLLELIHGTPYLDWLLLTKRPQNWRSRLESVVEVLAKSCLRDWVLAWLHGTQPANVWIGTTVEDQARADERIPALLKIPARVRFLSCEPLLDPVVLHSDHIKIETWRVGESFDGPQPLYGIHWVICGGESGPQARPMDVEWAHSLRRQCKAAGVPFFMKQLGGSKDKRHEIERFPADLQVREFPS